MIFLCSRRKEAENKKVGPQVKQVSLFFLTSLGSSLDEAEHLKKISEKLTVAKMHHITKIVDKYKCSMVIVQRKGTQEFC